MENNEVHSKLPIKEIFLEAVSLPQRHTAALLRFGFPFIVFVVIGIVFSNFQVMQDSKTTVETLLGYTWFALYMATLIMAVIGCHRIFLLNTESASSTKVIRWTGRETRYILWWVAIGLIAGIIILPVILVLVPLLTNVINDLSEHTILLMIGISIISIPVYYLASRWSLVLPATAIDERNRTLMWSWNLSKHNGWRLTLLIGFLPFITDLFFQILPEFESIAYSLFVAFAWIVVCTIEIGLLSLSYAYLSKMSTDDSLGIPLGENID